MFFFSRGHLRSLFYFLPCVWVRTAICDEVFDIAKKETFLGFFKNLLSTDFMPHGHCLWWRPEIVWLHVISDAVIVIAYYSIPIMLVYFARKKKELPFHWIFLLFGAFIFWCGTTHALNIWTLWFPVYRLDGVVKAITASVSLLTAILLFPLIPQALSLRSPGELERANKELEEENLKRRKAEMELQESLDEKEALLKEIHHRVKNNLQITMSFLSLQAKSLKDESAREVFLENENRIRSMALVHEKLYGSKNLSAIDMGEYIEKLVPSVMESYGATQDRIRVELEMQPIYLSIDKAIPLGLILNELLSNAFKHGVPIGQTGRIRIQLRKSEEGISLEFGDSGGRFPKNVDFYTTPTLGLKLVNALVKQLNGRIILNFGDWTEFRIQFK